MGKLCNTVFGMLLNLTGYLLTAIKSLTSHDITWHHMTPHDITTWWHPWHHMTQMKSHDTTWHDDIRWHHMTSHYKENTHWGGELSNLQVLRVWSRLAQPVHEIPMVKNNNKGPIGQCNTHTPSFPLSRVLPPAVYCSLFIQYTGV